MALYDNAYAQALISSIAYSDDVDRWKQGTNFQGYIRNQKNTGGALYRPQDEGEWVTESEHGAILDAAASNSDLSGFKIGEVHKNPYDGSDMIYLYNPSTGEGCFVFEGTCTKKGWYEDGRILAVGDTASQDYAVQWAQGIMNRNESEGKYFSYSTSGHSKGGSQAAALARADSRITAAYSFDGPGDDVEHSKDPRIHCINNENDPVSALLYLPGDETLISSHSPDPNHATGMFGAHSPANLFNFYYDENGNLVCDGIGSDVTSKGGAWYRDLMRTATQVVGLSAPVVRDLLSYEVGLILYVAMDDSKSTKQKLSGVLSILVAGGPVSYLLVGTAVAGVALWGTKKLAELGLAIVGKVYEFVVDAFVTMGQAVMWAGEQLASAIDYVAGVISAFISDAWESITSWVQGAIDWGKKAINKVGSFFEKAGNAISNFFSGGPKTYDFSSYRLDEMRSLLDRAKALESFDPSSWDSWCAGMAFVSRLSLRDVQSILWSAINYEGSSASSSYSKACRAFEMARQEDSRYSSELAKTASAVRVATGMFA